MTKLQNLIQLDLSDCPISQKDDYRKKVFGFFPDLKILDNKDENGQEFEYSESDLEGEECELEGEEDEDDSDEDDEEEGQYEDVESDEGEQADDDENSQDGDDDVEDKPEKRLKN